MKKDKGSIAIFVLVALLFMSAFLIISLASNVNKSKTVKEQFNMISGIYAYANGDKGAYDKAYSDLRNKNKQTMTASVENSSTLELTKTFKENLVNYRIYGNSVQNGTPTPTNPVEIQSVGYEGDLTNNIPAYEPYGKYKIPVKVSAKNIFNEQGISGAVVGNGTAEKIKNGWKVAGNYGDPSATKYANGWFRPGIKGGAVSIEAGKTVTISADIKLTKLSTNLTNNNFTLIYLYGTTNTTSSVKHYLELNTVVRVQQSFTTTVSGNYYPLFTLNNNELEITNIQIEKGNIATDYEQYQEPITTNMYLNEPLIKVRDYADYIDFKTGKVVRNIGKIDSYNGETITTSWISSTGELSTGATVYYVLETPIEETVTLPQLKSYEDYTKIEILTSVAPSKIEAEYVGYTLE